MLHEGDDVMDAFRNYLLRLICAALVAGILSDLSEKTSFKKQMRLVCSLFVTVALLEPLVHLSLPNLEQLGNQFLSDAKEAVVRGENFRVRSVAGIIKDEAESYIQKEASAIGAELTVEITLDAGDPPAPESVILRGSFDASSEWEISSILTRELGIPKENQTWIRQEPHAFEPS